MRLEELWDKVKGIMEDSETGEIIDSTVMLRNPDAEVIEIETTYRNCHLLVKYEKEGQDD